MTHKFDKVWVVYLLRCRGGSLYCGMTNDLSARLDKHLSGKASRYTRAHLPVELAYCEPMPSQSAALKREYAIKQLSRADKEHIIRNFYACSCR